MKVIIFKNNESKVSIVYPAAPISHDHTEEDALHELASKVVPANTPWKIIDTSEIPADRTFRDAWEWED
jgi:hypothetical protein